MIVTRDDEVLSSAPCDLAGLMSCTHEEADTRMFVHATYGAEHGMNKIILRTVDIDVVVIGISMAQKIGCDCSHLVLALHSGILTQQLWLKHLTTLNVLGFLHSMP